VSILATVFYCVRGLTLFKVLDLVGMLDGVSEVVSVELGVARADPIFACRTFGDGLDDFFFFFLMTKKAIYSIRLTLDVGCARPLLPLEEKDLALLQFHGFAEMCKVSASAAGARGKRRGFSPGAAARHSQSARVHMMMIPFIITLGEIM